MKPLIGISPLFNPENGYYQLRGSYTEAIEQAGGIPVILPLSTDPEVLDSFLEQMDGFLFAGGHDIQPRLYTSKDLHCSGISCARRDDMELYLFERIVEKDLPALGICRGAQLFNIARGGDLYQDISREISGSLKHFVSPKNGQGFPSDGQNSHDIDVLETSGLYALTGKKHLQVNSFHHQAIRSLGDGFRVMARSSDGIIEAIELTGASWIWGVQWHPEVLFEDCPEQNLLFTRLVEQASRYRSRR